MIFFMIFFYSIGNSKTQFQKKISKNFFLRKLEKKLWGATLNCNSTGISFAQANKTSYWLNSISPIMKFSRYFDLSKMIPSRARAFVIFGGGL